MSLTIDSDIGTEKDDKPCYDTKSVNVFSVVLNAEVQCFLARGITD